MATMTKEQIQQKLQQLKRLTEESDALLKELAEAGALELSDEELEVINGSGGGYSRKYVIEVSESILNKYFRK